MREVPNPEHVLSLAAASHWRELAAKPHFKALTAQEKPTARLGTCHCLPSSSAVLSHLWKMILKPQNHHLEFRLLYVFALCLHYKIKSHNTLLSRQRQACIGHWDTHTLFSEISQLFLLLWKQWMNKERAKHGGCCAPSAGLPWASSKLLHPVKANSSTDLPPPHSCIFRYFSSCMLLFW